MEEVRALLARSPLFRGLAEAHRETVIGWSKTVEYGDGARVVMPGQPSDGAFVVIEGALNVLLPDGDGERFVTRVMPGETAGELGVLLGEPRTAALVAHGPTRLLVFGTAEVNKMLEKLPGFGMEVARQLAGRLHATAGRLPLRDWAGSADQVQAAALAMLPVEFVTRHRVLPLTVEGRVFTVGVTGDPSAALLRQIAEQLPSMEIRPVRVAPVLLDQVLATRAGTPATAGVKPELLDALLRRMVTEGASDLHLSACQVPRWRLHGRIAILRDLPALGPDDVRAMLEPIMLPRVREEFQRTSDADFAYAVEGVARFRVNAFRDAQGSCCVIRQIPARVLSFEQLGLPDAVRKLCDHPKGLVLVTGPTGSGKSTTLAAMIDAINKTRPVHILTLEDPIEFVHESKVALVNQREVGTHTGSFARALKAALREDPDVVLVGEMRDRETVQMALETANTGHLVFATLHTNTAPSTIERIVDLFPADQQGAIRASLAEVLRGVVCQMLCRKIGGGRVAALEIMVSNPAIANLIREEKTFQILSQMQTGGNQGQRLLNADLARLVTEGQIDGEEAISKAIDKGDLGRRIGK